MPPTEKALTCAQCQKSLAPLDLPFFVERTCDECGQLTYLYDRDPKTSGLRVLAGDRVRTSHHGLSRLFRLKGGARFSRAGLNFYAATLFSPPPDVLRDPARALLPLLDQWIGEADEILKTSSLLQGLDIQSEEGANEVVRRVGDRHELAEWWAVYVNVMCQHLREALDTKDAFAAAGAGVAVAAARAMLKFKTELEEIVWRGHSVEELRTALTLWNANRLNDNEEFWQQLLSSRSFVLSQIFSTPVVVLRGKAFVGGKSYDNTGGNLADFLLRNELTTRSAIIELKLPTTPLLTKLPYRNHVYAPSPELSGAVAQVSAYAASLAEEVSIRQRSTVPIETARSECVVIIGTTNIELTDDDRRRSFELYRSELRNVRVVTYDELFKRIEALLRLFGG
ncbi:Shedu anti-phage system protein SduA domain-containing protein [Sorangium sp. So ce854]|uniref:Shedu immune nuclease family protein n=1 Tax=Sorangium sp. So ce854 TaxID=3133322 RepID=UPI003F5E90E4